MANKKRKTKVLSNNLKTFRTRAGMKVTDLAKLAGVSTRSVHGLENQTRNISIELKYKILHGLNHADGLAKKHEFKDVFPHDQDVLSGE